MRAEAALAVLFLVNVLNFFDRQVLGAVVEPLRRDLALGDRQVGWLGTAFILLYAVVGLPLGRLVDTGRRTTLLAAGVLLWTGLTAGSALATGFATLFLARLGVGVGEAVCAPAATSLIGDLFPPQRRARATSVFMLGLPVGIGLSYAVSAAVAEALGWRAAFLVAGLPGLLVAALCLRLPEPPRGASEAAVTGSRRRAGSPFALLLRTPTLVWIIASGALHNFNLYALSTFLPAYLTRVHGLSVRDAGAAAGVLFGVLGGVGMLAGGWAGDRLAARRADGRMLVPAAALTLSVPLLFLALAQPPGQVLALLLWLCPAALLLYVYYAPVYATIQDVTEPALRGTAMAVYFFAMYLLGAALGPVGTGALSDALARRAAERAGQAAVTEAFRALGLREAMTLVPALSVLLALVLLLGARTVAADRRAIEEWSRAARSA